MKKILSSFILAMMFITIGCDDDDSGYNGYNILGTVTLSIDDEKTKTFYTDKPANISFPVRYDDATHRYFFQWVNPDDKSEYLRFTFELEGTLQNLIKNSETPVEIENWSGSYYKSFAISPDIKTDAIYHSIDFKISNLKYEESEKKVEGDFSGIFGSVSRLEIEGNFDIIIE